MKHFFLLSVAMMVLSTSYAAQPNDTVSVDQADVKRWVQSETTNAKGAKVTKYYCIWKDELVSTSKNVYEKAMLCKQYGAKCALICIGKKSKGKFSPKRIALN